MRALVTALLASDGARRVGKGAMWIAIVALIGLPVLVISSVVSVVGSQREAVLKACADATTTAIEVGGPLSAGLTPGARARFYEPLQMQPGRWYRTGATRFYNAPGDATGTGSIPDPDQSDLMSHPDTFAELSVATENPANYRTFRFSDANALGQLPYLTALRVAHGDRSAVVFKRDVGFGQGADTTSNGERYRIDLWGPVADRLRVSKHEVRIALAPRTGAGATLGDTPDSATVNPATGSFSANEECAELLGESTAQGPLPLTDGERAQLLPNGLAAAPRRAPKAVKEIIAAGNQLVGKPYVYGGAHGSPLSKVMPGYDCSSSVSFLLYGARLVDVNYTPASGTMAASLGEPGYGRWVSVLAHSGHVYAYIAGLRWDTHNAVAGERGAAGIGWHTGRRDDVGFTARHPKGL